MINFPFFKEKKMNSLQRIIVAVIVLFSLTKSFSQDFHYSLINNQPLVLNPALTGVFDFDFKHKDLRLSSLYRQQWTTVASNYIATPKPYHTTSFSADGLVKRHKYIHGDYVGVGFSLAHDQAGDLKFKSQQANVSVSYNKSLNGKRTRFLTLGFQGGIVNRSVDYTNGYFDNQWTGVEFNPSLSTGESFPTESYNFADLSTGLVYEQFDEGQPKFMVGLAYFHFNNPRQYFYDESNAKLRQKFVFHGLLDYPISIKKAFVSHLVYSTQNNTNKLNVGTYYKVKKIEDKVTKQSVQVGGGVRMTGNHARFAGFDAVYVGLKVTKGSLLWGVSYDTNTSKLISATNSVGAFELSLIYYLDLYKRNRVFKKKRSKYKPKCAPKK